MDYEFYLNTFQRSADQLDKKQLNEKQLEIFVGVVLNSVGLKLYKKEWASDKADPVNSRSRIFFSIWVNDDTLIENKIFYNIHAFKLRELKGYSITSREFATNFRKDFEKHRSNWENVSVKFGPLTLMEGWKNLDVGNLENTIVTLSSNFLEIEHLIDGTLKLFRNDKRS
jgi:hypothetical protein